MDEYFQSWVFNPAESSNSFWSNWLEENPNKAPHVEEARATLQRLNFSTHRLPDEDVTMLWNQIRKNETNSKHTFAKPRTFMWYSAVAAMLIMGIVSFFWMTPPSFVEHQTAFGETKRITLPDSSTVILNSNSTLRLNANWKSTDVREVWLDGEAFFSVVHNHNNQPFEVKTGEGVDIEVLGTTFNVYHRDQTKIVLNTGRIQLSLPIEEDHQKIVMKPGELVEYSQKKYVKRQVDTKMYTAWTENNLVLNRTSLREMLKMIKDNYGIEVAVAKDSLLDQTISGSMPVTDSEGLLDQISKAFRLHIVKEENRIYLLE